MIYAVFQTFCVLIFANLTEIFSLFEHIEQNLLCGLFYLLFRGDEDIRREQCDVLQTLDTRAVYRVE